MKNRKSRRSRAWTTLSIADPRIAARPAALAPACHDLGLNRARASQNLLRIGLKDGLILSRACNSSSRSRLRYIVEGPGQRQQTVERSGVTFECLFTQPQQHG